MRKRLVLAGAIILVASSNSSRAQLFNLEDEDIVTTGVAPTNRVPSSQILKVPASELPEDAEDTVKFDKTYSQITSLLKENKVDEAMKIISGHDVLTKQKIVYRLMKEDPNDFRQPASENQVKENESESQSETESSESESQ